jgi:hypothetical protein
MMASASWPTAAPASSAHIARIQRKPFVLLFVFPIHSIPDRTPPKPPSFKTFQHDAKDFWGDPLSDLLRIPPAPWIPFRHPV